jgi:hypothetical protein
MIDLEKVIADGFNKDDPEHEWNDQRVHISDLAVGLDDKSDRKCRRQLWLRYNNYHKKNKNNGTKLMFKQGNNLHEILADLIKKGLPDNWEVVGVEKQISIDFITGRYDCQIINKTTGKKYIIDFKTVRGAAFNYLNKPKGSHILQVQSYMLAENADGGFVIYADREGQNFVKQFEVKRNDEKVKKSKSPKVETPPLKKPKIPKIFNSILIHKKSIISLIKKYEKHSNELLKLKSLYTLHLSNKNLYNISEIPKKTTNEIDTMNHSSSVIDSVKDDSINNISNNNNNNNNNNNKKDLLNESENRKNNYETNQNESNSSSINKQNNSSIQGGNNKSKNSYVIKNYEKSIKTPKKQKQNKTISPINKSEVKQKELQRRLEQSHKQLMSLRKQNTQLIQDNKKWKSLTERYENSFGIVSVNSISTNKTNVNNNNNNESKSMNKTNSRNTTQNKNGTTKNDSLLFHKIIFEDNDNVDEEENKEEDIIREEDIDGEEEYIEKEEEENINEEKEEENKEEK